MLEDLLDDIISSISHSVSPRTDWGEKVSGSKKDLYNSRQFAEFQALLRSPGSLFPTDQVKAVIRSISARSILGKMEQTNHSRIGSLFLLALSKEIQPSLLACLGHLYKYEEIKTGILSRHFDRYISILESAIAWQDCNDLATMFLSICSEKRDDSGLFLRKYPGRISASWIGWFAITVERAGSTKDLAPDREELLKVLPAEKRSIYAGYLFCDLAAVAARQATPDYVLDYLARQLISWGSFSAEEYARFAAIYDSKSSRKTGLAESKKDGKPRKVTPTYQEPAPRVGPTSHLLRLGNVTEEEIATRFGLRAIQYGNWVSGKQRQEFLNQVSDACADLAFSLGIPEKKVGFEGFLALAIGARGEGSSAAHYEPGYRIINLTKTRGAGALAHEWSHALDHYFLYRSLGGNGYASVSQGSIQDEILRRILGYNRGYNYPNQAMTRVLIEKQLLPIDFIETPEQSALVDRVIDHLTKNFKNKKFLEFFTIYTGGRYRSDAGALFQSLSGFCQDGAPSSAFLYKLSAQWTSPLTSLYNRDKFYPYSTDFYFSALFLDRFSAGKYWSSTVEMWARIVSAGIHDLAESKGIQNSFLSGFSAPQIFTADHFIASPNPEGEERKRMFSQFTDDILPLIQSL